MPAADMGRAIAGSRGRDFRSHRVADRAISTINANLMLGPRILFAMGRDGLMSRCITSINSGGTPSATLFLSSAVTIGLVLSARFEALVAITAILFVAVYLSGFASLFVLRAREPEFLRRFKMWSYPWTNLAICLASAVFLVASIVTGPRHAFFTLAVAALSYPVYFVVTKLRRTPEADPASSPVSSWQQSSLREMDSHTRPRRNDEEIGRTHGMLQSPRSHTEALHCLSPVESLVDAINQTNATHKGVKRPKQIHKTVTATFSERR
jgi:amino acid permease